MARKSNNKDLTQDLPALEKALEEINGLVEQMENGALTLEQSLERFERGIKLIKHCQSVLTQAEQKVQILIQNQTVETLEVYESLEE